MKPKGLPILFLLLVLSGLILSLAGAGLGAPKAAEKPTPVITHSFAAREVWLGETWKIYLNASDPDGEMTKIFATVEQPGQIYPLSILKVRKEKGKEFSGFLYLSTAPPAYPVNGTTLTVTIEIQDRGGNLSRKAVFPLTIQSRAAQAPPPPGIFQEEALGPVMVTLKTDPGPK